MQKCDYLFILWVFWDRNFFLKEYFLHFPFHQPLFRKRIVSKDGRLREWGLVSNQMVKQWRVVTYESFRNSFIIHEGKTNEINV